MSIRAQLKVMVVDDMSTSRGLINQALDAMGIVHVANASTGPEALSAIGSHPVHLVISDYNMPGMDGLALLRAMRAEPRTRATGFILITGRADAALIDQGRSAGMNNFIAKPFTPVQLKACLEAVVGRL